MFYFLLTLWWQSYHNFFFQKSYYRYQDWWDNDLHFFFFLRGIDSRLYWLIITLYNWKEKMGHSSNQEIASSFSLVTLAKARVTLLQFNDTLTKETNWKLSQIRLMLLQEKWVIASKSASKTNKRPLKAHWPLAVAAIATLQSTTAKVMR